MYQLAPPPHIYLRFIWMLKRLIETPRAIGITLAIAMVSPPAFGSAPAGGIKELRLSSREVLPLPPGSWKVAFKTDFNLCKPSDRARCRGTDGRALILQNLDPATPVRAIVIHHTNGTVRNWNTKFCYERFSAYKDTHQTRENELTNKCSDGWDMVNYPRGDHWWWEPLQPGFAELPPWRGFGVRFEVVLQEHNKRRFHVTLFVDRGGVGVTVPEKLLMTWKAAYVEALSAGLFRGVSLSNPEALALIAPQPYSELLASDTPDKDLVQPGAAVDVDVALLTKLNDLRNDLDLVDQMQGKGSADYRALAEKIAALEAEIQSGSTTAVAENQKALGKTSSDKTAQSSALTTQAAEAEKALAQAREQERLAQVERQQALERAKEQERLAKVEREKAEAQAREQERIAQQAAQREREAVLAQAKEQERLAQAERQQALERAKERERLAKLERGKALAQAREQERLAREAADKERLAKAEAERLANEAAERERLAKAESERLARAEAERLAAEAAERERVAKAEAERRRQAEAMRKVESVEAQLKRLQETLAQLKEQTTAAPVRAAAPQQAPRHALVIGNAGYTSVGALGNAVTDARAFAKALSGFGFQVALHTDIKETQFKQAVLDFKNQVETGSEVVFYYAGHGVQFGTANYLLPVDVGAESSEGVKGDSVELQQILNAISEKQLKFTLAVIDACRDNPFAVAAASPNGRSLADNPKMKAILESKGVTPTNTAAIGQMVIYSASAGQQALDSLGPNDRNPNGLFTRVFLEKMSQPGMPVDRVLRLVKKDVVRLAKSVNHDQVPALYDQTIGEFFFKP
jgi:hypothetical protein